MSIRSSALVAILLSFCLACGGGGSRQPDNAGGRPPEKFTQWKDVPRRLTVGAAAYMRSTLGEQHVRLVRTEELHKKWVEAVAAADERKQIEVNLHPSNPLIPLDNGIRVKVLALGDVSVKVELMDGKYSGDVAFCRPQELDPGVDRVPFEVEKELPELIEEVRQPERDKTKERPATKEDEHLPDIVDHRLPPGSGRVHVQGYYRNGKYVQPHTRSAPGSNRR